MSDQGTISIVLIEDQQMSRIAYALMLADSPHFKVVDATASGEEAIPVVAGERPDICLVDLRLPGLSGPDLIRALIEVSADTRVVVITGYEDDARILACLAAGAHGYLSKDNDIPGLQQVLRLVMAGKMVIDFPGAVAAAAHAALGASAKPQTPYLSRREVEMVVLVGRGFTNRDIADRLGVGEQTVKNTLRGAMRRLNAPNRAAAAVTARTEGLI